MKFLYTNIKQLVRNDEPYLLVRGRGPKGERVEVIFNGFEPRFFALDKDIDDLKHEMDIDTRVRKVMKWKNQNHPVYPDITGTIYKDPASVVLTNIPKDVRDTHDEERSGLCETAFKDRETFQSDLRYHHTFLVWTGMKSGVEIPDEPDDYLKEYPVYNWKSITPYDDYVTPTSVLPIDIESHFFHGDGKKSDEYELPITAVSLKMMGSEHMWQYIYNPEKEISGNFITKLRGATGRDYRHHLKLFRDEKTMLKEFIDKFVELDADINTAWNSNYDFGYIINRCRKIKLKEVKNLSSWNGLVKYSLTVGKNNVSIAGRSIIDSLKTYYERTRFSGEKHDYGLDAAGKDSCGAGKIQKVDDKGHKITTGELIQDLEKFIRYNAIDTELVELIGERLRLWGYVERFRRRIGCPSQDVFAESTYAHIEYCRRAMMEGMCFINRDYVEETYGGGMVFDPIPGLYDSVTSYDYAALYPSIVEMFNMSLETLVDPSACTEEYLETCIRTPNGLYFKPKSEIVGFITTIAKEMKEEGYKIKEDGLKAYNEFGPNDPRTEGLDDMYAAIKAARNTICYGVLKHYNIDIAAAITAIGREAIVTAKEYMESKELLEAIKIGFGEI
jgi:DNA polymerase elongation subunit (family B)